MPIARQLQNMGMPLYGNQAPTGYSMKADAWVNSSALLGRMNFAMALTSGKIKGVQVDTNRRQLEAKILNRLWSSWKIIYWQAKFPNRRTTSSALVCKMQRSPGVSWTIQPARQTSV